MTQDLRQIQKRMEELHEKEVAYCKENDMIKNQFGAYIYLSADGKQSIRLDGILRDYKQWLIDNGYVKEI
jgi:hypothetical protein